MYCGYSDYVYTSSALRNTVVGIVRITVRGMLTIKGAVRCMMIITFNGMVRIKVKGRVRIKGKCS